MWRPQASASKAMRRPRLAARSPSSRRSAAARSMPPSESGETLLQIISRSVPSSCMTSNLRSARAKARSRWPAGMPSKSRNGCRVTMSRPSSPAGVADVGRRAVERDEIVLEDLHRVEFGGGDGFELLAQGAAQGDRRDRGLHAHVLLRFDVLLPLRRCASCARCRASGPRNAGRRRPPGARTCRRRPWCARLARLGGLQELGLERRVDHVGDELAGAHNLGRHRQAGMALHADRRGVDDAAAAAAAGSGTSSGCAASPDRRRACARGRGRGRRCAATRRRDPAARRRPRGRRRRRRAAAPHCRARRPCRTPR